MTNPEIPEDAKGWSAFLSSKQLPATPKVGTQVLSLLRQGNVPYQQLASVINRDPILSFYVLAATNMGEGKASRSSSLEHAISMIGVKKLETLTAKASYFKPDPANIRHFYYLRALSTSLYSAYLIQELAQYKPNIQAETGYWASLFYGAPWWYLWRFATPEMRLIRYAIRANGKAQEQAEKEVLGCTIREISIEFAKQLAVPSLTLDCYKPENTMPPRDIIALSRLAKADTVPDLIEDKRLRHQVLSPTFSIMLCNMLAQQATHDWYSSATLRCQKILSVFLGLSLSKTIALTHQVAATMSRAHPIAGVMAPATKIMLPPREYVRVNSFDDNAINQFIKTSPKAEAMLNQPQQTKVSIPLEAKPVPQVKLAPVTVHPAEALTVTAKTKATEATDSNRKLNYNLFKQLTDCLTAQPDQFSDLHEIMNAAVQGITYGLGLKRSTVALVNTKLTRLKAYYTVGTRKYPELGNFQIDLTQPSLFSRLIEKQAGIWIGPTTQRSTWNMIPAEFKRISGASEFFLMSVFVNKKPVAVFYADGGVDAPAATEWEYRQFKYMCSSVTKCLNFQSARAN